MEHSLAIGGLRLGIELCPSFIPRNETTRDWVHLSPRITTPYSRSSADKLLLSLPDLLSFRKRLYRFLREGEFKAIAMQSLMPSFDMIFTLRPGKRILLEVRLSPEIRLERHMYDFDVTCSEVECFCRSLDTAILSFPNEKSV